MKRPANHEDHNQITTDNRNLRKWQWPDKKSALQLIRKEDKTSKTSHLHRAIVKTYNQPTENRRSKTHKWLLQWGDRLNYWRPRPGRSWLLTHSIKSRSSPDEKGYEGCSLSDVCRSIKQEAVVRFSHNIDIFLQCTLLRFAQTVPVACSKIQRHFDSWIQTMQGTLILLLLRGPECEEMSAQSTFFDYEKNKKQNKSGM